MKTFFWNLVQKIFKAEIQTNALAYSDSQKMNHFREMEEAQEIRRAEVNFPVGKKVIIRSNEPDPLFIGLVSGYELIQMKLQKVMLVKITSASGQTIQQPHTSLIPWAQEREDALNKLSWDEQWNVVSRFHTIHKKDIERKNSTQYQAQR